MINFQPLENWIGEPLDEKTKVEMNKIYEKMVRATELLKHGNPLSPDDFFVMCIIYGYKNLKRMRSAKIVETILEYKVMQSVELKNPVEVTV